MAVNDIIYRILLEKGIKIEDDDVSKYDEDDSDYSIDGGEEDSTDSDTTGEEESTEEDDTSKYDEDDSDYSIDGEEDDITDNNTEGDDTSKYDEDDSDYSIDGEEDDTTNEGDDNTDTTTEEDTPSDESNDENKNSVKKEQIVKLLSDYTDLISIIDNVVNRVGNVENIDSEVKQAMLIITDSLNSMKNSIFEYLSIRFKNTSYIKNKEFLETCEHFVNINVENLTNILKSNLDERTKL